MGCGSSTDADKPKQQPKSKGQPPEQPRYEPFTDFPTPRLLAQAQRDYAGLGIKHDEPHDHQEIPDNVPAPFPPPTTKDQVFKQDTKWDEHALQGPLELALGPFNKLVDYLIKGAKSDIAKVRAFYVWIACQRVEQYDMSAIPSEECPLFLLLLAKARRLSYNKLFEIMCSFANIPCITVIGGAKGLGYVHGEAVPRGNTWCLVYVDGAWRLVDQHFGSFSVSEGASDWSVVATDMDGYGGGSSEQYLSFAIDEDYFLPDPEIFIYDHHVEDPKMQLLARPVTSDEFTQMANLWTPYFEHGIVDISEPRCKIINEDGQVQFSFTTKPESFLRFNYVIFKHIGNKAQDNVGGEDLQNYVSFENKDNMKTLVVRFKHIGLYKIKFMVTDVKNSPDTRQTISEYVVRCNCPFFNLEPFPSMPAQLQELGPGADWKLLEVQAQEQGGVITAEDGYAQLNLKRNKNEEIEYFFQLESRKVSLELLRKAIIQDSDINNTTLHMKLPVDGTYLLKAHTRENGELEYTNTCNYLVIADTKCTEGLYPKDFRGRAGGADKDTMMEAISHKKALFDVEGRNEEELKMKMLEPLEILLKLTLSEQDKETDYTEYAWFDKEGDIVNTYLRFMNAGTYKFVIYTRPVGSKQSFTESWKYLINVDEPTEDCRPFPTTYSDWTNDFVLLSPKCGALEEQQEVTFEVQVKGAKEVYIKQHGHDETDLEAQGGSIFKGIVMTKAGTLTLLCVFGNSSQAQHLLRFKVMTPHELAQLRKDQQSALEAAERRRKHLQDEKEAEKRSAERRQKEADEKAQREKELFEKNKDKLFEEEERLEKEALDEYEKERKKKELELEKMQNAPDDAQDIIQQQVEDVKEAQNSETARRRHLYSDMQKDLIRDQMRAATKIKKTAPLEEAIAKFEAAKLKEKDKDLEKAKRALGALYARDQLLAAMEGSDPDRIAQAIDDVILKGYEQELENEIIEAEKILQKLERLQKLKLRILDLNNSTMQELRGYKKPNKEVHEVIQAALLLLGENEERTEEWKDCQKHIKNTGQNPIQRRMMNIKVDEVQPEIAARVQEILDHNDFRKVQMQSAGAATIYVWAMGCMELIEDKSGTPANTHRQKELLGQQDLAALTPKQWAQLSINQNSSNTL